MIAMDGKHRDRPDRAGEGRGKRAGTRVEDLEVVMRAVSWRSNYAGIGWNPWGSCPICCPSKARQILLL